MGNVTGTVASKFAFFPPEPPTYKVLKEEDGKTGLSFLTAEMNVDVHILETKSGNKIVATLWKHPFARFTFLYSHGNAADLGQMVELFIELRAHFRVNIMGYIYIYIVLLSFFLFNFIKWIACMQLQCELFCHLVLHYIYYFESTKFHSQYFVETLC